MLSWLGLASLLLGIGIFLTWKAYTDSAISSGQVSVTVYVTINPAHVSIKSHAYLNPRYDSIDVNVTGPKGMKDPWILVVQCPAGAKTPKGDPLLSEGTAGLQQLGYAIVSNHDVRNYRAPLGCFGERKRKTTPPLTEGKNIHVTLPILEQNAFAQSAPAETPLYVERSISGHQDIADLVEALQPPHSSCTDQGPVSGAAPMGSAPVPLRYFVNRAPVNSNCYHQVTPGTTATKYYFPTQAATFETLGQVDLANETVDSMIPPGQITSGNEIKWQGLFSLSPSLNATSLASGKLASILIFIAGVFLGVFGGFLVPIIQSFIPSPEPKRSRTGRPPDTSGSGPRRRDDHE
jgi:hypothetical protein